MPKYFDCHSHLNFKQFDEDRDALISAMKEGGVWTITVGTDSKTSKEAVLLATEHDHLFATVGVHPTDFESSFDRNLFFSLAENKKVVATGECGFDYFRTPRDEVHEAQKKLFEQHIELALSHNLPLMLHCRPSKGSMNAYEDTLDILEAYAKEHGEKVRGNSHFFVGSKEMAERFLSLGFTLSFDGPITFSSDYDDVVRFIPLDMMLAETDAPFATPAPYRGKRNQPSYVKEVVRALARIRGEKEDVVRQATVENALRVFEIDTGNV